LRVTEPLKNVSIGFSFVLNRLTHDASPETPSSNIGAIEILSLIPKYTRHNSMNRVKKSDLILVFAIIKLNELIHSASYVSDIN
jgi:hypothetical protein